MNDATPVLRMGGREWTSLLLLSLLWGGSFFFFKVMLTAWPPLTIVLARVGLAAIMLHLWLALRRDPMPASLALWGRFFVMGLLNNVLAFSLIVFGETRISSGLAAILVATTPIFTGLVAHVSTDNERLTRGKLAGIATGFAGVLVLVGPGLPMGDMLGALACLGAALAYGLAGVYGRRFRQIPAIKVATGQITASTIMLLPMVALIDRPWSLAAASASVWLSALGIALGCTVLAYILFFRILAVAGAGNISLVTLLVPVSAVLLGALVLGEALMPRQFLGMALIGTGLVFIDGRLAARIRAS